MNNDRELLELAAKAAGIFEQGEWFDNYDVDSNGVDRVCCQSFVVGNTEWNPLTDDGDALRLAVKLGLMVDVQNEYVQVFWNGSQRLGLIIKVQLDNEPYAATRRCITRAAAEIGKGDATKMVTEPDIEEMTLTQIADKHKPVKQEPVAWYGKSKSGNVLLSVNCVEEDWQPLYAKPVELVPNPIGEVDIYMDFLRINWKDGRHPPRGTKLYAAPVDAKAIRARGKE